MKKISVKKLSLADLTDYSGSVYDNGEPLVSVDTYDNTILHDPWSSDMYQYTGSAMLVRDSVAKMLAKASASLRNIDSCYRLRIRYGYRHPLIQDQYYREAKSRIAKEGLLDESTLEKKIHEIIADPRVAGHPTGGAVDVDIVGSGGVPISFGCRVADFSVADLFSFSAANIRDDARRNRELLLSVMVDAGFAPFEGEWWHYSYGDTEWAVFYGMPATKYNTVYL